MLFSMALSGEGLQPRDSPGRFPISEIEIEVAEVREEGKAEQNLKRLPLNEVGFRLERCQGPCRRKLPQME